MVCDFYLIWDGENARTIPKGIASARDIFVAHGPVKAKHLLPLVVKELKDQWPDGKMCFVLLGAAPNH